MNSIEKFNRFKPAIKSLLNCMDDNEIEHLMYIGTLSILDALAQCGITFEFNNDIEIEKFNTMFCEFIAKYI